MGKSVENERLELRGEDKFSFGTDGHAQGRTHTRTDTQTHRSTYRGAHLQIKTVNIKY